MIVMVELLLSKNKTGFRNVFKRSDGQGKKAYEVRVWRDKQYVCLGYFATPEDAALCFAGTPEGKKALEAKAAAAAATVKKASRQQPRHNKRLQPRQFRRELKIQDDEQLARLINVHEKQVAELREMLEKEEQHLAELRERREKLEPLNLLQRVLAVDVLAVDEPLMVTVDPMPALAPPSPTSSP